MNKGEFRDALYLRYGWDIRNTPQSCVCGSSFSIDHVMTCKRGGFTILRHNEIRDMMAKLLSEVCHNVATEPPLQPLSGETFTHRSANVSVEARLDIKARDFWNSTRIFQCEGVPPKCSLLPLQRSNCCLQATRIRQKQPASPECRARCVHTPGTHNHGQYGLGGLHILQMSGQHAITKARQAILHGHGMAKMPT